MTTQTITFIGSGNMTRAIVGGLLANGYDAKHIWATNRTAEKLVFFYDQYHVHTTQNNREGAKHADILILAIKPDQLQVVCDELKDIIAEKKPLIISVVTGISVSLLQSWLNDSAIIVRAIPNTAVMVGAGAIGLYAGKNVTQSQKNSAESIFRAVGLTLWIAQEDQMHIVTALSGSGPAYFFLVMEAMQQAACKMGLPLDIAKLLTLETALGAARMALEADQNVEQLRRAVTSPQGTTEHGVAVLEKGNIRQLFSDAITAACERSKELADTLKNV